MYIELMQQDKTKPLKTEDPELIDKNKQNQTKIATQKKPEPDEKVKNEKESEEEIEDSS
jgi:hypothetical protein